VKKIYQKPLTDVIEFGSDELMQVVVASGEDDAAGSKKMNFEDDSEMNASHWDE
jgi:hypothetical protein